MVKLQTFARIKTFEEIAAQCKALGVPLNAKLYLERGWDTIIVGLRSGGNVCYNAFNGRFFGTTPDGIEFNSTSTEYENEQWFKDLLNFFYVPKD